MKPKRTTKVLKTPKTGGYDDCATPPYALDALTDVIGWLHGDQTVWEPAVGDGLLKDALVKEGYDVVYTHQDFFQIDRVQGDWIITNPPYSNKYKWIERALRFGVPTALLMPVEAIGAAAFWEACRTHECGFNMPKLVIVTPRINFKMPNKGWNGTGAQFPTCWYLWNFWQGQIKPITVVQQTKAFRDRMMRKAGLV